MLEMPRLPAPMATRAPGFTREAKSANSNCSRVSVGRSGMLRSGRFCLTRQIRGSFTPRL